MHHPCAGTCHDSQIHCVARRPIGEDGKSRNGRMGPKLWFQVRRCSQSVRSECSRTGLGGRGERCGWRCHILRQDQRGIRGRRSVHRRGHHRRLVACHGRPIAPPRTSCTCDTGNVCDQLKVRPTIYAALGPRRCWPPPAGQQFGSPPDVPSLHRVLTMLLWPIVFRASC